MSIYMMVGGVTNLPYEMPNFCFADTSLMPKPLQDVPRSRNAAKTLRNLMTVPC